MTGKHGAALVVVGLLVLASVALSQGPAALRSAISTEYPDVEWVTTSELARWLRSGDRPVLLDVREAPEFAQSHLAGARRVSPGNHTVDMDLEGKRVVVYCSVGYRSAALARTLQQRGARQVYNLVGGLFQWANEGRPMVGQTPERVHPYDATWGRLLNEERRGAL
ncbi:MAG: rhodanese-like domain-containing protein [Myxococcota bacterium]